MALCQNLEISVCGWFNKNEWLYVKDLLYSADSTIEDKKLALDIMQIWKARTAFLPAGAEGTLIIVEVIVKASCQDLTQNNDLTVFYSNGLMRFLNLCAAHDKRQGTFYKVAKKMNIPDWLINLRHEIAHNALMPSIDSLKKATEFSFEWLYKEYWNTVDPQLQDHKHDSNVDKLTELISIYECIVIAIYSKYKYLNELPTSTRKQLLNDLNELKEFKHVKLIDILKILIKSIFNRFIKNKTISNQLMLVDILLNGDTFLLCQELSDELSINNLPFDFIKLWAPFLNLLHRLKLLELLFVRLIMITFDSNEPTHRQKLASLWIKSLLRSCLKLKYVQQLIDSSPNVKNSQVFKNNLFLKELKPELIESINLQYLIGAPSIFSNFEQMKPLFSQPNLFVKNFLNELIDLIDFKSKLEFKQLIEIYVGQTHFSSSYLEEREDLCKENLLVPEKSQNQIVNLATHSKFEKCSDYLNFAGTPLGVLPWQDPIINPFLHL